MLIRRTGEWHTRSQGATPRSAATVTVIVPTRNEAGNVAELVRRLDEQLPLSAEILFVDDSDDATPREVLRVAGITRRPVGLLHRPPDQRGDGLGGAVVAGFRSCRSPWVVVMDGDLQHPPEMVPALARAAARDDVDVVVASRYCVSGDAGGLSSRLRAQVSESATSLAKWQFKSGLEATTDPMSGFFAVRVAALDLTTLRPVGFKILMEVLVRHPHLRVTERPFIFGSRFSGRSKASAREGLRFLRLVFRLRLSEQRTPSPVVLRARHIGFITTVPESAA